MYFNDLSQQLFKSRWQAAIWASTRRASITTDGDVVDTRDSLLSFLPVWSFLCQIISRTFKRNRTTTIINIYRDWRYSASMGTIEANSAERRKKQEEINSHFWQRPFSNFLHATSHFLVFIYYITSYYNCRWWRAQMMENGEYNSISQRCKDHNLFRLVLHYVSLTQSRAVKYKIVRVILVHSRFCKIFIDFIKNFISRLII